MKPRRKTARATAVISGGNKGEKENLKMNRDTYRNSKHLEKQETFFWEQSISARQHMCLAAHLARQASPADPL